MRRLVTFLVAILYLGYCNGQLYSGPYPEWFNQTVACTYCGELTYNVVFAEDKETLISAIGLMAEYNWCPQYYPYITLDYCVSMHKTIFGFFYRPYYTIFYPLRDYMCYPICGNSGANFTSS